MADEARNTKTECILSICVRFFWSNGDIIELFLSVTGEITKATAPALLSKVEEVFHLRNIDMNTILCCSFDGVVCKRLSGISIIVNSSMSIVMHTVYNW